MADYSSSITRGTNPIIVSGPNGANPLVTR